MKRSHFLGFIGLTTAVLFTAVMSAGAQSVNPQQASYNSDEEILVDFSSGPGNAADWIGIYLPGETPDGNPLAEAWYYTNGTKTSGGNATSGTVTFPAGSLTAGSYKIWFLANNGYTAIAGPVDLTITAPAPQWVLTDFRRRHAVTGTAYTGNISAYTNDTSHTFSKVSGPAWLSVAANGVLSGTPAAGDVGINTFTVRASQGGSTADATVKITVFAPGTESVSELKVMSFNAWHGFGQINNGHAKGVDAIIKSDADIIGMQESLDNVSGSNQYQPQAIAAELGWYYRTNISGSLGLISRYPITDQTLAAGIARGIKVRVTSNPLREVILMTCHLDYTDYGPYAAQLPGATVSSVLAEENSSDRDEQIAAIMSGMSEILGNADDVPVFLTGDFNAPSHLDWTEANKAAHDNIGAVPWPTSTAVINGGMLDSFRQVNPDPVVLPGDTWSPIFKDTEPQDRIDFVYFKGTAVTPTASIVFTTAVENTTGAWGSSITPILNNTFPSDHAAVLTTFKIKPVDADTDGLSDAFENKHFGNITSQTGSDDKDGDGSTNRQEQLMGTDPDDASSKPLTSLTLPTDLQTAPTLTFSLSDSAFVSGLVCERSTDLTNWNTVWSYQADPSLQSSSVSAIQIGSNEWSITVTDNGVNVATASRYFYRLREGT